MKRLFFFALLFWSTFACRPKQELSPLDFPYHYLRAEVQMNDQQPYLMERDRLVALPLAKLRAEVADTLIAAHPGFRILEFTFLNLWRASLRAQADTTFTRNLRYTEYEAGIDLAIPGLDDEHWLLRGQLSGSSLDSPFYYIWVLNNGVLPAQPFIRFWRKPQEALMDLLKEDFRLSERIQEGDTLLVQEGMVLYRIKK